MQSKKVLIMPDPAERLPHEGQRPALGPGPIPTGDIETVFKPIDIYRAIGRLDEAVNGLGDASKLHEERLHQLTRQVDEKISAIPGLKETVNRHTTDLNELGRRLGKDLNELGIRLGREISDLKNKDIVDLKNIAHTAKILGYIALTLAGVIGAAFVTYLFRK